MEFAQGRVLPGEAAAHRIELRGIVDGEPGILSALDLPVIPGRGVIRADSLKGTPA